jgi:preprotein translocase subunit SecA
VLAHVELRVQRGEDEPLPAPPPPARRPPLVERHDEPAFGGIGGNGAAVATAPAAIAPWAKTPRNAPCPCGSGKKYKHCHGRL